MKIRAIGPYTPIDALSCGTLKMCEHMGMLRSIFFRDIADESRYASKDEITDAVLEQIVMRLSMMISFRTDGITTAGRAET